MEHAKSVRLWAAIERDHGPDLRAWISDELDLIHKDLELKDDERLIRRAQGQAKQLRKLLELLDSSPGLAARR